MAGGPLSFVTVVFESELLLLHLQARSMATFLPASLAAEIVVIDNSRRGLKAADSEALMADYGTLRPRVRILRPAQICAVPSSHGWRSQQVLKLEVADKLHTDRYVTLDAKNHFVATPDLAFFESPDGRARVNVYGYETHPLRPAFEGVMAYLGLDPLDHVEQFTATVTPFVLDVAVVKAMIADIERRSGHDFPQEFVEHDLLEFFLYSGWIITTGRSLSDVFDFHQRFCPTIWPRGANAQNLSTAIEKSQSQGTPLFSLHRKALAALDSEAVALLAQFWADRGLFGSASDARLFIASFKAAFARSDRRRKIREVPGRARKVAGNALSRLPGLRSRSQADPVPGRLAGEPQS